MAFTEFCCRSGGSNLNAGTRTGSSTEPGTSANFTYASGSWVSSTGVFTVASGNPSTDGVAVGDFASVYADGASVTTLVGRVTAVSSTTITVSTSVKSGTTTDGTSNRTLKIGGAWQGPNGTSGFPFTLMTNAAKNTSSYNPRINFKNDQTYSITAAISNSNADMVYAGYTSSYGDTGRATIDGGSSGASYVLLTNSAVGQTLCNFVFQNNGATGTANGVLCSSTSAFVKNCIFTGMRGAGISFTNTGYAALLEAYGCNTSNTANIGGIHINANPMVIENCISHDNSGSNNNGFYIGGGAGGQHVVNCIADTNGLHGFFFVSNQHFQSARHCVAYNNGGNGFYFQSTANRTIIQATNLIAVNNTLYGMKVEHTGGQNFIGDVRNFGHYNNTSGSIIQSGTGENASVVGTVALGANPFVDAPNGDFRINLAAAKNAGWESFVQTAASYAGTVGYPDLGAAQAQASGSSGVRSVNIRGGADQ